MKKLIAFSLLILALPLAAQAGKLKDLVLDAEDAIIAELTKQGEQVEDDMTDFKFTSVPSGIGVQARVISVNSVNGAATAWLCTVTFQPENDGYVPTNVSCIEPRTQH